MSTSVDNEYGSADRNSTRVSFDLENKDGEGKKDSLRSQCQLHASHITGTPTEDISLYRK